MNYEVRFLELAYNIKPELYVVPDEPEETNEITINQIIDLDEINKTVSEMTVTDLKQLIINAIADGMLLYKNKLINETIDEMKGKN